MTQKISKYLSFLSLVLITGLASIYSYSLDNIDAGFNNRQSQESSSILFSYTNSNTSYYHSAQQDNNKNQVFYLAEILDVESKETAGKITPLPLANYFATFTNTQVFNGLSFLLQENSNRYKNYLLQPSTKTHIRHQVFLI